MHCCPKFLVFKVYAYYADVERGLWGGVIHFPKRLCTLNDVNHLLNTTTSRKLNIAIILYFLYFYEYIVSTVNHIFMGCMILYGMFI